MCLLTSVTMINKFEQIMQWVMSEVRIMIMCSPVSNLQHTNMQFNNTAPAPAHAQHQYQQIFNDNVPPRQETLYKMLKYFPARPGITTLMLDVSYLLIGSVWCATLNSVTRVGENITAGTVKLVDMLWLCMMQAEITLTLHTSISRFLSDTHPLTLGEIVMSLKQFVDVGRVGWVCHDELETWV